MTPTWKDRLNAFKAQAKAVFLCMLLSLSWSVYRSQPTPLIGPIKGKIIGSERLNKIFMEKCKAEMLTDAWGAVDTALFAPDTSEVKRLIELVKNDIEYTPEVWDCDDFSRHFKDTLLHQWAKEGNLTPLGIVEVYAKLSTPTEKVVYHAFNAVITSDEKLIFIEPQGPRAIRFHKVKILGIIGFTI